MNGRRLATETLQTKQGIVEPCSLPAHTEKWCLTFKALSGKSGQHQSPPKSSRMFINFRIPTQGHGSPLRSSRRQDKFRVLNCMGSFLYQAWFVSDRRVTSWDRRAGEGKKGATLQREGDVSSSMVTDVASKPIRKDQNVSFKLGKLKRYLIKQFGP